MLVQFTDWKVVVFAFILCIGIFLTRYIMVRLLFKRSEYTRHETMITIAMGPRGLACAVLATIPVQKNIVGAEWLQNTLFSLIPMSIFFTALFVVISENDNLRPKLEKFF